jgi:GT2 family glycosyltransferase
MSDISEDLRTAAVVVTYNRLPLLKECIDSLRKQTRKLDKILIINNSSTDGTVEWLNEQKDLYVVTQENLGGAGGFHTGIKTAFEKGFDWIWCMDDDAEPLHDALEKLLISDIEINKVSALCGRVDNVKREVLVTHRGIVNLNKINLFHLHTPTPYDLYTDSTIQIDICSFVGILINRKAVEMVGLPKREFFIHLEDIEYCLRLAKYGKIILVPQSIIIHKEISKSIYSQPKKFLWKKSNRIPVEFEWKTYYRKRNFVWIIDKYYPNLFYRYCTLIMNFWKYFLGIILYDDHKLKRINLLLNAYADGLRSNFNNKKPIELNSGKR